MTSQQEWSRFDDDERRIDWQAVLPEPVASRGARVRQRSTAGVLALVGAVVVLAAALLLTGRLPRGHPLLPALDFALPGIGSPTSIVGSHRLLALDVPRVVQVGAHTDFTGDVPGYAGRGVSLAGSYDGGRWITLARTRIGSDGRFTLRLGYTRPGLLRLRLAYPNGDTAVAVLTVR